MYAQNIETINKNLNEKYEKVRLDLQSINNDYTIIKQINDELSQNNVYFSLNLLLSFISFCDFKILCLKIITI